MLTLAAHLLALILRALGATLRLRIVGAEHLAAARDRGHPILFTSLHGRMLVPVYHHRRRGMVAMVSRSKDGELAARLVHALGFKTVRGSSSAGGKEAFLALAAAIESGADAAIIPDGPRGPAEQVKPGLIYLAAQTGATIVPVSASATPHRRLRSWDRFVLPLPFARAVIVYGVPVVVPANLSSGEAERIRLAVEQQMCRLGADADLALAAVAPATATTTGSQHVGP